MIKTALASLLLALGSLLVFPDCAAAQLVSGTSSDTVIPYLNLINNQFGLNTSYQTLVRPMMEDRQAAVANTASIQRLQNQVNGGVMRRSGAYGTHFMNYSHFYTGLR